ncbi:inorganic diphosphatase [Henriciella litoralis]|uniref:inorganic diphosphatase n=1 Tax=Henriciella litoralis TaxID=568102 RepID=UPI0009FC9E85|nr:inorganic diphosphatase [Henriciella litoralis]
MDISKIKSGQNPPDDINVLIEVPLGGEPIKYEIDKASGAMFVDRYLYTSMRYPCNYGFVPHTLSLDGDPIDVMVVGQRALVPGAVVRARPIGVLLMEDDGGEDEKILAVPHPKLTRYYEKIHSYTDVPETLCDRITHFFEHYKDLEPNKWVKVRGWEDVDKARELISASIERAKNS